jgi:hypothetical protein
VSAEAGPAASDSTAAAAAPTNHFIDVLPGFDPYECERWLFAVIARVPDRAKAADLIVGSDA